MLTNYHYSHHKSCAALSILIHVLFLCSIFLSFITLQKKKKELPEKPLQPALNQHLPTSIAAPVILYSGPIGMPQHKLLPQTHPSQTAITQTEQATADKQGQKDSEKESAPKKENTAKAKRVLRATYHGPLKLDSSSLSAPTTLETIKHEKTKEEVAIKTDSEIPELFQAAQPNGSEKEETADSGEIRKRRLELADLFKTMPHLMKKLTESSEPGEQLVVVQGDMKYYSFLKTFLQHINQVFAFHGGPEKLLTMAKAGHLKKNAGLSVVINQQGHVLSKKITHSSGHQPADSLILDAIEQANPFPPVPKHFNHKTVRVELISMVH